MQKMEEMRQMVDTPIKYLVSYIVCNSNTIWANEQYYSFTMNGDLGSKSESRKSAILNDSLVQLVPGTTI
jgi:hypothetical protein